MKAPIQPTRAAWRRRFRFAAVLTLGALILAGAVLAQQRRWRSGGEGGYVAEDVRTAREVESHSTGTPNWTNDVAFAKDVFTFTRVRYQSSGRIGRQYGGWQRWTIDFPDSDLNLSWRVHQMTSLKVSPDGRVIRLTDKDLFKHPWIYVVEPGDIEFTEEEVVALRNYLNNGGFVMFDDFWGEWEYRGFYDQIKRVFPNREPVELDMDHPLFHAVFDIKLPKRQMQVPNVGLGMDSQYNGGVTWERSDAQEVHFKGIFDDKGRMMVFVAHNSDNGDGWEREGEHEYFFKEFSEKKAFPLGINVIFYSMTH